MRSGENTKITDTDKASKTLPDDVSEEHGVLITVLIVGVTGMWVSRDCVDWWSDRNVTWLLAFDVTDRDPIVSKERDMMVTVDSW